MFYIFKYTQPCVLHDRRRSPKRHPFPINQQVFPLIPSHSYPFNQHSKTGLLNDWFWTKKCSIRHITAEVGAAVLRAAVSDDIVEGHGDVGPKDLSNMSKVSSNWNLDQTHVLSSRKWSLITSIDGQQEDTVNYITRNMWFPIYSPLVHEK